MRNILVSWIGGNDLEVSEKATGTLGPILSTLKARQFSQAYLLYNYPVTRVKPYLHWLTQHVETPVTASYHTLESPIHFADIYQASLQLLQNVWQQHSADNVTILLSPGTPAMQAVWILLGKTRFPVTFLQSSREAGVQEAEIPFDITAEFLPSLLSRSDQKLTTLNQAEAHIAAEFSDIVTNNPDMKRLIHKAQKLALRDVPVLIMGESGTGKELFAKAIHNASTRKDKPLIVVNCGALPSELIDSELFGHVKGAFTGAVANKDGYFKAAEGGSIFLDEFGELPAEAQVRLLRVLQSGEFNSVGQAKSQKVNVRVIAATNRNLAEEISAGRFREDLFYRVAVGMLHLPPLRERHGDLGLISQYLMDKINEEAKGQPGYTHKKISVKAKNIILNHPWPGNVRELHSTLLRASLWAEGDKITDRDIQEAILERPAKPTDLLGREIDKSFRIEDLTDELRRHYVTRALAQTGGSKTKAAELLGLKSYQVLTNWMKSLGLKE